MLYVPSAESLDRLAQRLMDDIFSEPDTAVISDALAQISNDPDVRSALPGLGRLPCDPVTSGEGDMEANLLNLYLKLHRAGAGYTREERETLNRCSGIDCQPGGLLPVMMSALFIGAQSTTADIGAGNGLQGMLLQRIKPHKNTIQIELSSGLVNIGRLYQRALGITGDRITWKNESMEGASIDGADLVYLYRPVKPAGRGNAIFDLIAGRLNAMRYPVAVVSVMDCLGPRLDGGFMMHYKSEHVSVFVKD